MIRSDLKRMLGPGLTAHGSRSMDMLMMVALSCSGHAFYQVLLTYIIFGHFPIPHIFLAFDTIDH